MALEDDASILRTGTARGIFSFGGEEILLDQKEVQIHEQNISVPTQKRKDGRKKGERDGDNAKHRQGCKTTINSCFRWLETHLQNVVRLGVYSR